MPFSHLKVVRVVSGRDLYGTRTEFHIHVIVADNNRFSIDQGHAHLLADIFLQPFVIGVYGDGRITHNSFRPSRGNHDVIVFADDGIFYIPQMPRFIGVIHFNIAQSRMTVRAPVCNAVSLINKSFFIQSDEYFPYSPSTDVIHGEALARPVTG